MKKDRPWRKQAISLSRNSPHFTEHEVSLPHPQQPATCHHPEAHEQLMSPSHSLKIHFIIYSHLCLGLPRDFFPSGSSTKTLFAPLLSPIRATRPANSILLDFVNRIILGELLLSPSAKLYFCIYICLYLCLGINTLRTESFKLFKRPFPGFLTILIL